MKLYTARFAPNPLRVEYFLKEKGIFDQVEKIEVELAEESKTPMHLSRNGLGQVPVLELDDGQFLSESRAICTYLEGQYPTPNLMGHDVTERAFIEMTDRQIELSLFFPIANWIRHSHPGLVNLEKPQVADWANSCALKAKKAAAYIDAQLSQKTYIGGDNFTISDITLYCAFDFARLAKYRAWDEHKNIARWRDLVLTRPAFGAK